MADVLLITIGSHGDVHPFIGIGRALQTRGHRVRLMTNPYFTELVGRAGLEFIPLGDRETFTALMADPLMWHPQRGPGQVMRALGRGIEEMYELTLANADDRTLIVGSTLALGALIAAERNDLRYATAHLAPLCIRSRVNLPTLPGGLNLSRAPAFVRRKFWEGADRWFIDPTIAPAVNALRRQVGLSPIEHVMDWWNAPRLTIGLWPEWFAPRPPDAPPQLQLTDFPLYDEADHHPPLDADLYEWLAEGEPPIAFTPGSAMTFGHRFFAAAAEACERIERRGLLLTRHIEQIPQRLPPMVRHLKYAPFSELLPRCAALVHHGGIGTTSQALRAGVPQLIMPMSHDQPDNAAHVKQLGVGDAIARTFFWPRRVARKLARLTTSPAVAMACDRVAAQFRDEHRLARTLELIEGLGAPSHDALRS